MKKVLSEGVRESMDKVKMILARQAAARSTPPVKDVNRENVDGRRDVGGVVGDTGDLIFRKRSRNEGVVGPSSKIVLRKSDGGDGRENRDGRDGRERSGKVINLSSSRTDEIGRAHV